MSTPTTSPPAAARGPFLLEGGKLVLRALGWLLFIAVYLLGLVLFNAGRLLIAASEWGLGRTTRSAQPAATPPAPSGLPRPGPDA